MPPPVLLLALPPAVVGLAARAAAHLALAGDGAVGADAAGREEVRGDLDGLGDVGLCGEVVILTYFKHNSW